MPAEVPLQVELTGAIRTLEGLAASMEMHVPQQVVHSVERFATYLEGKKKMNTDINNFIDICQSSYTSGIFPLTESSSTTHLAFEWLYRQVDNHVRLEGLLLNEALEADVTLEWSDAVVDEHVPLQVGRQGELP